MNLRQSPLAQRTDGKPAVRPSSLRQSMASLHTWVGLLPGWILYLVFLFGTTAYFQEEISRWMRPELRGGAPSAEALQAAQTLLERKAADAASWMVSLPSGRDGKPLRVSWRPREEGGEAGSAILDERTGREISVRDTSGGFFLYRFHFELSHMPPQWARLIVWISALAMLVAILSGVITHKKIFADFFLLRLRKGQRSWLDAHNVTGVLALPFHLMITYTGLCSLLFTLMPWPVTANFASEKAFTQAAYPLAPDREREGRKAPVLPFGDLIAKSELAAGGAAPSFFTIANPGDVAAVVTARPRRDRLGSRRESIHLDGATGTVLSAGPARGAASATQATMIDIHTGLFADLLLRWLYFLSGVLGTAMVGSGLILWTVKRRTRLPDPARPHLGFRLVERLNIGMMIGPVAGIAAYFLANRLLPFASADRADREIETLFLAWGLLFGWVLSRPPARAWIEGLATAALLYAMVPLVNALTTTRGLVASVMAGDWVYAGFDMTMAALSGALAFAAWQLASRPQASPPRRARRVAEMRS
ncbi:PepSY-associated TM helix domain-containing protein [Novosphingobium sp.]|jgi:uncharacterized iron-regulated membrane protein|uniref:PepSY-associated TM helix domain-containing protein n=1 Tax=Novosphingobium sp. TaxID=1874826 RepID=UPI002FE20DFD